MKKVFLVALLSAILLTGCDNKEETEKNEYLAMKSDLLEVKNYASSQELACDITINVDRKDEEKVSYEVILSNPKENMNNIKAIVVHNYYTEEVFPSIGLFNKVDNLKTNDKEKEIKLTGTIDTTNDIDNLDLELKVLIKYLDDNNEEKEIYYKTT